jgi:SUN family beta-glucosidase
MKLSQFAILGTTAIVSAAQNHRHAHRHADKHLGSPVEIRAPDVVTTVVAGPTETIYELNGKQLDAAAVAQGLADGYYILVPDSTTPSASSTSTSSSSSSSEAAEFFQEPTTSSSAPTSTSAPPPPPPPPSSTTPAAAPSSSSSPAASSSSSSSSPGGTGLNSEFPSGTIPCSTFPSAYGAVAADWLGLGGYIGIQNVPDYSPGDASISYISTAVVGSNSLCTSGSFCSYACPPGYQKSQWPAAQGSTGQSIGGLYCNANGMLELSRPSVPQLCITGTGQVLVQNNLDAVVSICRTDYPGTESETVPLSAEPGQTYQLTCPDASNYYMWQGDFTSAQYYMNPAGVGVSDACQWQSADVAGNWFGAPGNIGNWAPLNMGVGKGPAGTTYISLFQNAPTNPTGALGFSVTITGDISGSCSYSNGQYWSNGVADPTGCTVSLEHTLI